MDETQPVKHHREIAPRQRGRARAMRHEPTDAEKRLWKLLRGRQFAGLKFRRQVPIGPYTVDFACLERRVIIEADGGQHAENLRDRTRDTWLVARGFAIWRFWNSDILAKPDGVGPTIASLLSLPW